MFRKKDIDVYDDDQFEDDVYDTDTIEEEDQDEYIEDEDQEAASEDREDEEEEEQPDEPMDEKSVRRIARRKRRIRNQIIAYLVMVVLIAGLACAGVYGGKMLVKWIGRDNAEDVSDEEEPPQDVFEITSPDVVDEQEETPVENPVDEVARYYISQMTTEEKVAGLFFVTPESMMEGVDQAVVAGSKTEEALNTYAVGGIIYFAKNIQSSDQISEMLQKTQEMSRYPLFLGVDEEGGTVARVADSVSDISNTGNASDLGSQNDATAAYNAYNEIGRYLKDLGFNVDFAPVADIYDGSNSMFAERSFGTDAELVSSYVYQAISGLQDNGISACTKHFPGHGSADGDPHEGRATVELTEEELMQRDIVPFQMAVSAGTDFIMIGQVSLPNVLADYTPATMSSDINTRILRNQLGYEGIIITDAMNMAAVTDYYTSAEAAVNAINAGCDMILMPENFKEAYQGVLDAVNSGEISIERIEESLLRIYRVKCAGMTMADITGETPAGSEVPAGSEAPAEGEETESGEEASAEA